MNYRSSILLPVALFLAGSALAQQPAPDTAQLSGSSDDVVVTGQYLPQSLRKSVYQVRTITSERIKLRGAVNIQQVLNSELGFRFSNDLTLSTTDIQLMGMSGRNVKILLDGVPMVDRGDTRESLNQIDINLVERIEIVEGPMSVSYGSDALAGVVNIITIKNRKDLLAVTARIQEETAGGEYEPFTGKGVHNQHVGVTHKSRLWNFGGSITHNESGGWVGNKQGREQEWKPKEQWLASGVIGYRKGSLSAWYRLDALTEDIVSKGAMGATYKATDQVYATTRFTHQAQLEWQVNNRLQLASVLAYTDYKRKTETTIVDFTTGARTPGTAAGQQDESIFRSGVFRTTAQYRVSGKLSLQPGIDINLDHASGARIEGSPSISDYAFFVSSEWKPLDGINIRPGFRFIKNSIYDAPPVIPSLNTLFRLARKLDLRMAYARGFRSPALRELYFNFFDASHSIKGNPNLKAEESDSFNGSLTYLVKQQQELRIESSLGAFYNEFRNLISYGVDPSDPSVSMTMNIEKFRTTGLTFENRITWKQLQAITGFSYIGRYNRLSEVAAYTKDNLPGFVWSPELNANIIWTAGRSGIKLAAFYKYSGKRPSYEVIQVNGQSVPNLVSTSGFHLADVTASKSVGRLLVLSAGVKNLFDVTRLNNTSADTGGAHSSGGAVPMGYGRSYFLTLNFNYTR
ncbi:TonB-dependent receptor plug domain-containing protein [Sediminibacterium ginsengisoli]|uniref:Outer membrane receptor for ferrienterochelin and colicins n=1 Tax=Sediminibacterium ginsengisoli TaxID=413434 RepID=A0A1T4K5S3_9BACT|nr:TonB-dependent receptor [Sediminibacterium ginsengisoli]SJZ37687.1 outer membrane receptor for ferrienterochelin and colicins [Sediminibacterium ginsengisoli]